MKVYVLVLMYQGLVSTRAFGTMGRAEWAYERELGVPYGSDVPVDHDYVGSTIQEVEVELS